MQFDLRVQVATVYKNEGHVHNSKQEQLVASAQLIPDTVVRLPRHESVQHWWSAIQFQLTVCCTCQQGSMQLHLPSRQVAFPMQARHEAVGLTGGKSGGGIVLALGTWAGHGWLSSTLARFGIEQHSLKLVWLDHADRTLLDDSTAAAQKAAPPQSQLTPPIPSLRAAWTPSSTESRAKQRLVQSSRTISAAPPSRGQHWWHQGLQQHFSNTPNPEG